ncbi:MAG: hypothetical protein JWO82_3240 [Akkermansiaceae bacterium]|nr:hypothetical protein [Akkermansiaceae bacterium]
MNRGIVLLLLSSALPAAAAKVLPLLTTPTPDQKLYSATAATTLTLSQRFGTEAVDDQAVRFTAQFPSGTKTIDMAMFTNRTPVTRANFLKYVADGDFVNSFIHRSVPGFVIQGGGYKISGSNILAVPTDPPIVNEFGVSNTYGTVSMAKVGGNPNSATSQWFISLGDNSAILDPQNGGFTVFARVTKSTLPNAALFGDPASFPVLNAGGAFTELPVNKATYSGNGTILFSDLILFQQVGLTPLSAADAGDSTTLTYSIAANSNPAAASVSIQNGVLTITPPPIAAGPTTLTVRATDSAGNNVDDTFVVNVVDLFANWRAQQFTPAELADDSVSGPEADPDKDGISNLELFVHGLPRGPVASNPVTVADVTVSGARRPNFTFPIRHSMEGVTYTMEKSTDLRDWTSVPFTTVSKITGASLDTLTIQPADPVAAFPTFYRVRFTLQ